MTKIVVEPALGGLIVQLILMSGGRGPRGT